MCRRDHDSVPTPEASVTTTSIRGDLDGDGRLEGEIAVGRYTETPMVFPFLAEPMAATGTEVTGVGAAGDRASCRAERLRVLTVF